MKRKVLASMTLVVLVVLLILVFPPAPHAAGLMRVQGPCIATSSGTTVFVNLIPPVDEDVLVAVVTCGSYTGMKTVSSVSEDNVSWYRVVSSSAYDSYNDYVDVEIWAANVSTSSAGETVMASFSGPCEEGNTITVCEYSGLTPFVSSVTATNSGQGGTPDTGTTASTSAQLDVGGLVGYANVFASPTNGFAMLAMVYTDTTYGHGAAYLERQVPQTGTVHCSVTSGNGNAPWAGAMATFSSPNAENATATGGTPLWAQWYLWTIIALVIATAVFAFTTYHYEGKASVRREGKSVVGKTPRMGVKTCPNCGAEFPLDSKFCGKCGASLE